MNTAGRADRVLVMIEVALATGNRFAVTGLVTRATHRVFSEQPCDRM